MLVSMSTNKLKSVEDLFYRAGSSTKIAAYLSLTAQAVELWRKRGIPARHRTSLAVKYGCTQEELHLISEKARRLNEE